MFDGRGALSAGFFLVTRFVVFVAVFVADGDLGFVFLAVGDLWLVMGLDVVVSS